MLTHRRSDKGLADPVDKPRVIAQIHFAEWIYCAGWIGIGAAIAYSRRRAVPSSGEGTPVPAPFGAGVATSAFSESLSSLSMATERGVKRDVMPDETTVRSSSGAP